MEEKEIIEPEDVKEFDKYVAKSFAIDVIQEFMEAYINYREEGDTFKASYLKAAADYEVELDEDDPDLPSTEEKDIDKD